jgi:hypothetical protein
MSVARKAVRAALVVAAVLAPVSSARALPVYGVTYANQLERVDTARPGTSEGILPITGLASGELIFGIDYRVASWQLYAVGTRGHTYTIDVSTGVATPVSQEVYAPLPTGSGDIDISPAVDRIRLVELAGTNLRIHPLTGLTVAVDVMLAFASGDPNAGASPGIVGLANGNNTTYGIDPWLRVLVTVGAPNGASPSANGGELFTVGSLGLGSVSPVVGFDFAPNNTMYMAVLVPPNAPQSTLYTVNPASGAATAVGAFPGNRIIRSLAVAPGSVRFGAASYSVIENAGEVNVVVSRGTATTGIATVAYRTVNGTALAGQDYDATSGSVLLADGQATRNITIPIRPDALAEGNETFKVELSGVPLVSPFVATVTIRDPVVPPDAGPDARPDAPPDTGTPNDAGSGDADADTGSAGRGGTGSGGSDAGGGTGAVGSSGSSQVVPIRRRSDSGPGPSRGAPVDADVGCGCRTRARSRAPAAMSLLALALLVIRRKRQGCARRSQ